MHARWTGPASRRIVLDRGLGALVGLAASVRLAPRYAAAQGEPGEALTASGGGVNLKLMPDAEGDPTVPLRESFSFDAHYAQCIIEDNSAAFSMDTFSMGKVVIETHTFFMAMYANEVSLASIRDAGDGRRVAKLTGALGCATEAGTVSGLVGSRTMEEPAYFEIEATDGGHGGGAARDSFVFTVFFDPERAPLNHAIFGPNPSFTGEMIAGEITIAPPMVLPLISGTPVP
jgi:hypothetical protein